MKQEACVASQSAAILTCNVHTRITLYILKLSRVFKISKLAGVFFTDGFWNHLHFITVTLTINKKTQHTKKQSFQFHFE